MIVYLDSQDNKMIRVDEEDGTGVDEEHVKTESDAKIDEIKGKKWRPKGRLIVPSGRDSSPSNKIPQLQPSPMHAPQTALDITKNMKTDLGKDSEGNSECFRISQGSNSFSLLWEK
ncbi:hypothetical protein AAMO2058_001127400 [Amorphochlora amoebiformis]